MRLFALLQNWIQQELMLYYGHICDDTKAKHEIWSFMFHAIRIGMLVVCGFYYRLS